MKCCQLLMKHTNQILLLKHTVSKKITSGHHRVLPNIEHVFFVFSPLLWPIKRNYTKNNKERGRDLILDLFRVDTTCQRSLEGLLDQPNDEFVLNSEQLQIQAGSCPIREEKNFVDKNRKSERISSKNSTQTTKSFVFWGRTTSQCHGYNWNANIRAPSIIPVYK